MTTSPIRGCVGVRVSVLISTVVLGLLALTGCGPSRYYDYDPVAEREAYEHEARAERAARARRKARRERARAAARAKARQRRAREVARSRPPEDAPEPVKRSEPSRAAQSDAPRATAPVVEQRRSARDNPAVAAAPAQTPATQSQPERGGPAEAVDEAARVAGRKQIEDGYRLLRAGFVKKARERFERAMRSNAAEASLGQARSMDPSYLKTVAFPDVIPNAEQARRMYRRAILLGNAEAKADLDRLDKAMAAAAPTSVSPVSPAEAAPSGNTQ